MTISDILETATRVVDALTSLLVFIVVLGILVIAYLVFRWVRDVWESGPPPGSRLYQFLEQHGEGPVWRRRRIERRFLKQRGPTYVTADELEEQSDDYLDVEVRRWPRDKTGGVKP